MPIKKQKITQKELKELLHYNHSAKEFIWIKKKGPKKAGSIAGTLSQGVMIVTIDGVGYRYNHLVYLYNHGRFPTKKELLDEKLTSIISSSWAKTIK